MEFCKAFNAETQGTEPGCRFRSSLRSTAIAVSRSFRRPRQPQFCCESCGHQEGCGTPNTDKVGKVTRAQLEEIATTKMPDLTAADMDAAVRTIAGTARSMGLEVEGVN